MSLLSCSVLCEEDGLVTKNKHHLIDEDTVCFIIIIFYGSVTLNFLNGVEVGHSKR